MKHHEWLQLQLARPRPGVTLSPLGKRVAQLLGTVYGGIYHLPQHCYMSKKTQWDNSKHIRIYLEDSNHLSTFDFNHLTALVILAHDYCVRLHIKPCTPRLLILDFHLRERNGKEIYSYHPTIEEAIADPEHRWRPLQEEVDAL